MNATANESPERVATSAPTGRGRYIPALDGLRGVAVLWVISFHYARGPLPPMLAEFTGSGWRGVDMFFVLSGFLITGILLDTKGSPTYLRTFWIRRALRIFPLYYGVLIALFVLLPPFFPKIVEPMVPLQMWLWTYLMNWKVAIERGWVFHSEFAWLDHFWSLAVEEQFYLFWPFVVSALNSRRLAQACVVLIVIAFVSRALILPAIPGAHAALVCTPCRMDCLAFGALAQLATRQSFRIPRSTLFAIFVVSLVGLRATGIGHPESLLLNSTVSGVCWGSLILLLVGMPQTSPLAWVFEAPWLRSVGKYSYGIYVFHWLLAPHLFAWLDAHLVASDLTTALVRLALVGAGFYLLARFSYELYEAPFLRLKERLSGRPVTALRIAEEH